MIDVIRRVFHPDVADRWLTVSPTSDFSGNLRISAENPNNVSFFGDVDIVIPYSMAIELGQSILNTVKDNK